MREGLAPGRKVREGLAPDTKVRSVYDDTNLRNGRRRALKLEAQYSANQPLRLLLKNLI